MKTLTFILAICLLTVNSRSQNLSESRRSSYYTYIYQITPSEAKKIFKKGAWKIDSSYYHSYIASFPTDKGYQGRLSFGYYLKLRSEKNQMDYQLESVNPLEVNILKNNVDLMIRINDSIGTIINSAKVSIGLRRIPFDKKTMTYRLKKTNANGILHIDYERKEYLYFLHRDRNNPTLMRISRKIGYSVPLRYAYIPVQIVLHTPIDIYHLATRGRLTGIFYVVTKPFRDIYNSLRWWEPEGFVARISCLFTGEGCRHNKHEAKGYYAFNKPMFKPGDTLKAKFYLLNTHNHPLKKEYNLVIKGYSRYNLKKVGTIHPYRDGFYETEVILHDSLKLILDKDYTLGLRDKKSHTIFSGTFRYEDYKLNGMNCTIRCGKQIQYPSDNKIIYVEAKNENGLNIPDVNVEIAVIPKVINYQEVKHIFIPDTLWKYQVRLDPVGESRIQVPDSVFPDISFQYEIAARFLTSENESKTEKLQLNYKYETEVIFYTLEKDTLELSYLKDGKTILGKAARLKAYNPENKLLEDLYIDLPCQLKVNPLVSRYIIHCEKAVKEIKMNEESPLIQCRTLRTTDSITIASENPRNLGFNYNIYCKDREIERGESNVLFFKERTTTRKNYFLSLQYIWAGVSHNEEFEIPFNDKNLNVQIFHPKVVYPGQTTTMKILVTNQKGEPAENVDLTAYANSGKFKDKIPSVPYLGKKYKGRTIINNFKINSFDKNNLSKSLDYQYWRDELGLDSIEYYKFLYPENGFYTASFPAKNGITQFAPFVFSYGNRLPIKIIYLDNVPIYFAHANTIRPYSFKVNRSGYHYLRLRLYNSEIIMDSLYLTPDAKTVISIDIHKKNPKFEKVSMPARFTKYEKKLLYRYTLYLERSATDDKLEYIEQNGNYQIVKDIGNQWNYRYITGPVNPTYVNYGKVQDFKQPFKFEPGYTYEISKGLVKMRCRNNHFNSYYGNNYGEKDPSEEILTFNAIEQKWKNYLFDKKLNARIFRNPDKSSSKNGKLLLGMEFLNSGFNLKYSLLLKYDDPEFVRVSNLNSNSFQNLLPGYYRVVFIGEYQHFFVADSLQVLSGGTNYYHVKTPQVLMSDKIYQKIDSLIAFHVSYSSQPVHPRNKVFNDIVSEYNSKNRVNLENSQTIFGRVTDSEGTPLPGVNVTANETTIGTITDFDGAYTLQVPNSVTTLVFSFIGFMTEEMPIGFSNEINCTLVEEIMHLDEIVVIGYGTSKKMDLTGSISKVNSGFSLALQGSVAGLNMNSYNPGGYHQILVRGTSTINSVKPIYIIDGVIYNGDDFKLDKNVIDKIEFLQNDQATAIYGSLAANGVILISTKKGSYTPVNLQPNNEQLPGDSQHSSIRKNFSDYAFWKPRLSTNEQGVAKFDITFPDDITSWKTFVLAAGRKKFTGSAETVIKSYKPVMGLLAIPDFLVEGDSAIIYGKSVNYSADTIEISRNFKQNDSTIFESDGTLVHSIIDTIPVIPENTDSLVVSYSLRKKSDNFFDGEERKIPVLPKGTKETIGQFFNLVKDTALTLTFHPEAGKVKLYAQSNLSGVILEEAKWLRNYPYFCNEQAASKLKALMVEKRVTEMLGQRFIYEGQIRKMINKLETAQKEDGLWGWWPQTSTSVWISAHVMEALVMAKNAGYDLKIDFAKITDAFVYQINLSDYSDKIRILKILKALDAKVDYETYIRDMEKSLFWSFQYYLQLTELKQMLGMHYQLDSLFKYQQVTMFGNIYWGEENFSLAGSHINMTIMAYKILRNDGKYPEMLPLIRNYLLEQRKNGCWRNTYESSRILETILSEILDSKGKIEPPSIQLMGAIDTTIHKFPFEKELDANDTLVVSKKGAGAVYLTSYQTVWNNNPTAEDKNFNVTTSLGNNDNMLMSGNVITMHVNIECKAEAEYVMLEIPIPAGCYYENKNQGSYPEVYREYFKNRVCIFFEKMQKDNYQFDIELISKFKGSYSLNPSRIELMYFPTFFGRNMLKKVSIQ